MTSIDLPPLTSCLSCCPGNGIGTKLVTFNITLHRWRQPAATSSCRIGLPMGTGPLSSWRNSVSRLGDLGGRELSGFLPFRSVSLLGSVALHRTRFLWTPDKRLDDGAGGGPRWRR